MSLVASRPVRIDEGYLDFVRARPCALCAKPGPSDAHHLVSRRWREAFRDDFTAIALCRTDHRLVESAGLEATFARYGWGSKDLALVVVDSLVGWFGDSLTGASSRLRKRERDA